MAKFIKKMSGKAGLPPGTLLHIGERKTEETRIRLIKYSSDDFEERDISAIEEAFEFSDPASITWINIDGIHQVDIIEKIGTHWGLHPLTLEDILNTDQRPNESGHDK